MIKSLIGLLIAGFIFANPGMVFAARTITVCPAAATGCDYVGSDGIQQAIDAASDGDTVFIKNGMYNNVVIDIGRHSHPEKNNLVIQGESQSAMLDGGQIDGVIQIGGNSQNITIKNLTLQNAKYEGVYVEDTSQATINNNIITGNEAWGISIINSSQATINNNTIYGNIKDGINCSYTSRCEVKNNISVNNSVGGIIGTNKDNFVRLEYNDSFGNGVSNYNTTFSDWPPATNISIDPLFVNPAGGDFHLQAGSPAINAGDPAIIDPDGTRSDMGAYWAFQSPTNPSVTCGSNGTTATFCWDDKGTPNYNLRINSSNNPDYVPGDDPYDTWTCSALTPANGRVCQTVDITAGMNYSNWDVGSTVNCGNDRVFSPQQPAFVCAATQVPTATPTPYHYACVSQACTQVPGAGSNTCNTDNDCTSTQIPGDGNGDGKVDGLDYIIWLTHYNQTTTGGAAVGDYQIPPDGVVDGLDYIVWLNHYSP